jgi:hypothetical protein
MSESQDEEQLKRLQKDYGHDSPEQWQYRAERAERQLDRGYGHSFVTLAQEALDAEALAKRLAKALAACRDWPGAYEQCDSALAAARERWPEGFGDE